MCPIVPCIFFVMWPRESLPPSVTRSNTEAFSTLSEVVRSLSPPPPLKLAELLREGLVSRFLLSCSTSPDVSIEQCTVCKEGVAETPALFLTAWRELKPSASSWRHSIPLAQTAPEIGPVFVRRSIAEMQPPPSSPPFRFPVRLWRSVGSLKWREVSVMWLESLFNLFRDVGNMMSVVIPHGFASRIGASPPMFRFAISSPSRAYQQWNYFPLERTNIVFSYS